MEVVSGARSPSRRRRRAAEPPGLFPARQQMALSLGWHIILAWHPDHAEAAELATEPTA